jgi:hypothetical protein
LAQAGKQVLLLDKGRSVGGRLATRRIGEATVDHGTQFFTVRTPEFRQLVDRWIDNGLVYEWCRGFNSEDPDGHPRYAVRWGMNALAKHLATEIQAHGGSIRCDARVQHVVHNGDNSALTINVEGNVRASSGDSIGAENLDHWTVESDVVVFTAPVPQTLQLFEQSNIVLPQAVDTQLRSITYQPTLAALIVLDGPSALDREDQTGAVQSHDRGDVAVSFVADNHAKGISTTSALTVHAGPEWSSNHIDADTNATLAQLVEYGSCWFGDAKVVETQFKAWRYAIPETTVDQRSICTSLGQTTLVFAGDAFGGPRVEGAVLSGIDAGQQILGAN